MLDFVQIKTSVPKRGVVEISPEFISVKSKDLMVRGNAFYGIWDEARGMWSRDIYDVPILVDAIVKEKCKQQEKEAAAGTIIKAKYLSVFSSNKLVEWNKYIKTIGDNYHELDTKIIFSNTDVKKTDYASKRLPYALAEGKMDAYEKLMSTLYDPEERAKLEWAIGSIISGDSKKIQKFIVLYGEAGTGKSTVLNIIAGMFEGYCETFEAKALGQANNQFGLEAFKNNPLVAIQQDGDLSRIEDNTKLNSLIAHETMLVNEKFKSQYSAKFNSFLFIGTNKPVRITEAKSGIIRRLIDVSPSGRKLPISEYDQLCEQVNFEYGAIAYHCLEVYKKMGKSYYNKYRPTNMIAATNDFYNFMEENYDFFSEDKEGIVLGAAWDLYQKYCTMANVAFPYSRRVFKEELKNYYTEFKERYSGKYKVYFGFRREKFDYVSSDEYSGGQENYISEAEQNESTSSDIPDWLKLDKTKSIFDEVFKDCKAQLASSDETPSVKWSNVKTKLSDISTDKLHYVMVPENLIVIDFDLRDKDGNKDPEANLRAASKWPPTYAEFSKSGGGLHLHYYYEGDALQLSRIYEENIEIKVFKKQDGTRGYSSLRRALSFCNDILIATINSGLPLKGVKNMVNFEAVKSEKALRTLIIRNLNKEYHGATAPSVDFIYKILEDAYNGQLGYDVSDLRPAVLSFAMKSTHQANKCVDLVAKMHFKSKEASEGNGDYKKEAPIIFFDVEVFENLLVICWKARGTPRASTVKMINPTPEEVKKLFRMKLVGFNNRRYDNHILYAAALGYNNKRIYEISKEIVNNEKGDKNCFFREAYNLSYTDIYDFASKKQSLKKWEIELGIHHQELGLPWDQPAPEDMWEKVADYCVNDVVATEAVFEARQEDWKARQILADLADGSLNDTTNSLTTKIVFGNERKPILVYTDLATGEQTEGR